MPFEVFGRFIARAHPACEIKRADLAWTWSVGGSIAVFECVVEEKAEGKARTEARAREFQGNEHAKIYSITTIDPTALGTLARTETPSPHHLPHLLQ